MSAVPLLPQDFRELTVPLTLEIAVSGSPSTLELVVESVKELAPHRFRAAPFSLVLRGPRAPLLPQGTYSLLHPRLGHVDVFLVPIGQAAQASTYEALFN